MSILILIILDVINHHFSQILISHFLKSRLKSDFITVTFGFTPEVSDSSLLLLFGHVVPLAFKGIILILPSYDQGGQESTLGLLSTFPHLIIVIQ